MAQFKLRISNTQYLLVSYQDLTGDGCLSCATCDIDYVDEKNNTILRFGYSEILNISSFFSETSPYMQKLLNAQLVKDSDIDLGWQIHEWYEERLDDSIDHLKYYFTSNAHKKSNLILMAGCTTIKMVKLF